MKFKINNNTGSPIHYENEVQSLCGFAKERLGFQENPTIFLNHDQRNADQVYGKTGYYDPGTMEIHVFATGRHPKDILRSIAHELVHHGQNDRGELDHSGYTGPGYAQKNPALRKSETEANDPMFFRDFEDWTKAKKSTNYSNRRNVKMSLKEWKNKELSTLLTERWGFKMNLDKLNEAHEEESDDETPETDDTQEPEEGEEGDEDLTDKQQELPDFIKDKIKAKKGKK